MVPDSDVSMTVESDRPGKVVRIRDHASPLVVVYSAGPRLVAVYRRLGASLANAVVFISIVGIGIVAGCFLAATEAVEDRWANDRRHHTSKRQ
jgi:hypothetical protein